MVTTSSSPLAGYGCVGAGVPPTAFRRIVGVAKAYSTCVGATPFVTELHGAEADPLRERGNEFGATTGRPRRVGWFDAVATGYGARISGVDSLAVMLPNSRARLRRSRDTASRLCTVGVK